jgi:sulfur-oxidizing protein SoxZ
MARALITVKPAHQRGDIIAITTLIAHPMETGFRADQDGKVQPRNIVRRFSCRYNGEVVFSAELFPAIAANPYLAFNILATDSGTLTLTWDGDQGFTQTESVAITVS